MALSGSGTPVLDSDVDFVVASIVSTFADRYVAQTTLGIPLASGPKNSPPELLLTIAELPKLH